MTKAVAADMDWNNLGFKYWDLPYRYQAVYKDGKWQKGGLVEDSNLTLSEAAEDFHYGQEVFEGLKAYRCKDGSVNLFRPEMNAKRMQDSAKRLCMATYPIDDFVAAVKEVVKANQEFIPPYGTGGSLYLRPFMIGTEPMVGVKPSKTYVFRVFATPVGAYIKGLTPMPYFVSEFDRAAYAGTGQAKTAGNYAGSLYPAMQAKSNGFADCLYLDPRDHKYIDEFGGANFYGITKDGQFVTPKSDSILPSVTKKSLLEIAGDLGMNPTETQIKMEDFDQFTEAGAMGTAAVISPVGSLTYKDQKFVPFSETETGPATKKLYDELTGIQMSERPDKRGWVQKVEL
ncbi:MAG: branched-chain amino acid aminotransferase [Liquorilactobacillus nagelii]|jgi:branched-chain amino acid aminotransferase|uniref:branched-chain amino acid aminotransferase n=1 Tax=Liquorilactobacillus nagelii TaxID=82688 RepID=UPI001CCA73BC|nr:branched-chain amino acid aminotransferase [Liquorilactobacillus nagelii]MCI1634223.1 branched-chain amino acid aminotransferase [Liquorilactobacillus nagelii]MCI1921328.1 branched-chain amino acid aminotransferase [Liquorilactobacillus nagelii]MCI1977336.1 branched-chain amino acid aminotransferase [Liquorilactobacillus nagelii]ULQ48674.1 branched-chain amino acid aminotransferase [Liquorilactobacillus nagelii]